jgi:hypothetical protein
MKKDELIEEKNRLGAKYVFVDNRYNDRHIFLFSDNQKNALQEILDVDGSLVDEIFQRVCNDDKGGTYSINDIKNVYYGYQD